MSKKLTFEQAIQELKKKTELLETGTESFEESIKVYNEATSLVKFCEKYIEESEQKITILE
ncbi:MAG: exodeoxyribonuclease VII small subunit [Oscillospiraceae bacterium]|jgi:exodeoxyribonuclease VII small subunit|nr:exodeoxyribonuclease VII small subunit [Oscillospiraceae bacterium]